MIYINERISLADDEVAVSAIRAQGSGGQNVNKVSSAVHLRFDIAQSSLSDLHKELLLACKDSRINKDGVLIIKAQQYRTQEQNRLDAFERLQAFIIENIVVPKARKATKPSISSRRKRVDKKTRRGELKRLRGRVDY